MCQSELFPLETSEAMIATNDHYDLLQVSMGVHQCSEETFRERGRGMKCESEVRRGC